MEQIKIRKLLAIPRSLLINLRLFGIKKGIKMPLLIANKVKFRCPNKNSIVFKGGDKRVYIGFGGSEGISNSSSMIKISKKGKIIFRGSTNFSEGISIRVDSDGILDIGNNFYCNKNCNISVTKKVTIGNDVIWGWDVNVRDSDGHKIIINNIVKKNLKSVNINNNVWIAAKVDILKGVTIPSDCVVAYRACVTKSIQSKNALIAGFPAKTIQENIKWSK